MIDIEEMFLTSKDLEKILHGSKNYVYNVIRLNGFPKIKIGKKYLIPKDKFIKWVNDNMDTEIEL